MENDTKIVPEEVVKHLDQEVSTVLSEVENSQVYRLASDPKSDPKLVTAIIKYILLEVFSYGPHVTGATFTAIGRFPSLSIRRGTVWCYPLCSRFGF